MDACRGEGGRVGGDRSPGTKNFCHGKNRPYRVDLRWLLTKSMKKRISKTHLKYCMLSKNSVRREKNAIIQAAVYFKY